MKKKITVILKKMLSTFCNNFQNIKNGSPQLFTLKFFYYFILAFKTILELY